MKAIVVFVVLMGLFYGLIHTPAKEDWAFRPYLAVLARAIGGILQLVGYDVSVSGTTVLYPEFSMEIVPGCDAIEPLATFVAAVLASPVRFVLKIPGILIGAAVIVAVNIVRLVSLFFVGLYYPDKFDFIHEGVWQAAFVALAIVLWFIWVQWATRGERQISEADAPAGA